MTKSMPWTDADLIALRDMREVGATAAQIAWALERSVPAINTKVHVLGWSARRTATTTPATPAEEPVASSSVPILRAAG